MKTIFFVLTLCLSFPDIHAVPGENEEIRWNQRQELAFNDFKGDVPNNTPWAALTTSYIYFTYSTQNGKINSTKVYASFKKEESWIKINREDVLEHEQLHFTITEIFARKLYMDAQSLNEKPGSVSAAANEIFRSINKQCDEMQEQYDDQTQHGVNAEKQAAWKIKVESLLKEYPAYPVTND